MSWFFKSLLNDDGDPENDAVSPAGVSQDLSAVAESISRQFRGVAGFLAPPPSFAAENAAGVTSDGGNVDAIAGIRSDFAEISGTLKNSLSLLSTSSNNAVLQISKLASDFLQLDEQNDDISARNNDDDDDDYDEEEEEEEVGIRDDVIEFARRISQRPELWIDFPLSLDHLDFDMSDAQSEHALVIEQLVPSLADVRSSISDNKSEKQFWMIYFILLLPRLNEDELELLSTAEIVEARETLLLMLRSKKSEETNPENPQLESSSELDDEVNDAEVKESLSVGKVKTPETPNESTSLENKLSDSTKKIARMEDMNTSIDDQSLDAKADDQESHKSLPDEAAVVSNMLENVGHRIEEKEKPFPSVSSAAASKQFQNEGDVSFSDLEDDDSDLPNKQSASGPSPLTRNSSTEGSTDWVRLNKNGGGGDSHVSGQSSFRDKDSEGEESTDWLTVDDYDS